MTIKDLRRLLSTRPDSANEEGDDDEKDLFEDVDPEEMDFGGTVDHTRARTSKRAHQEGARSHYLQEDDMDTLPRKKSRHLALPIDDDSFLGGRYAGTKTSRAALDLQASEEEDLSMSEDGEERFEYTPAMVDERLREQLKAAREEEELHMQMVAKRATDDAERGRCVRRQLEKWQSALGIRVRMQPIMTMANKMPAPQHMAALSKELEVELSQLDDELSQLVNYLGGPLTGRASIDESELSRLDKEMSPKWKESLDKWHSQAAITTETNAKRQLKVINQSLWNQAQVALRDGDRLMRRATTRRSEEGPLFGPETAIFDDGDFFPILLKAWAETGADVASMAGLTVKKVNSGKQKVDTRASKGRKLRYDVHDKLVNYMVPVLDTTLWTDDKIDSFYESVFSEK